ncbi:MAG: ABC transporter substrate-binding protein [Hyphomicrobiales bacterium]|nr:ABC transporter substrate-binding protein [Hyphomicrobiales bacterium]MDE2113388.1 ABC transporter substrate-binding protein [Hyphomicrobiales bacterium]
MRGPALSRRGFLGGSAVLASGLIVPQSALAADEPVKGGNLRLGLGGGSTTDSIKPGSYNDSAMISVAHALFNGLVEWDADGKISPELALDWQPKDSAKTWIVSLRKGIPFSNGKTFDADDAIYSINMHRGKDSKSGAVGALKEITDVKKIDANTLEFTLDSPDADFPYVLTDFNVLMVPNGHTDWANPIGTGAFVLEKFTPGVSISMKATGHYWKPGRGHVDHVDITIINDATARLNALISGQVDAINRVEPQAVALLEKAPNLKIVRAPGGWHAVMAMEIDKAPYDNPNLRLALKYAVDREQILKSLFSGYGTLGNDHPIPRSDPYFNTELAQRPHDPDKAKFYFKKAGLTDPAITLQVSDAAFNGAVNMGTLFQASTGNAGIKVNIKKEPADGFWSNVWLKGPFVASYWGGRAAATQMFTSAYKSKANWNETHWDNPKFDGLLAMAQATTDEAKRKTYLWDMQSMLSNEGGAVIPVFRDWLDGSSKKVGGHTPHGGYDMDNGMICEKAWLRA